MAAATLVDRDAPPGPAVAVDDADGQPHGRPVTVTHRSSGGAEGDVVPVGVLLAAITEISSDLDLPGVLTRVVQAAVELTGAPWGALGVVGGSGGLVDLVTAGEVDDEGGSVGDLALRRGVPVRIRGTVFGHLYLADAGDGPPVGEGATLLDALATAAGFVIDNARAYGLSERRRRWLEATAELTELLQPPIDLGRARQQIASAARAVSGSLTAAMIGLPDRSVPVVIAVDGSPRHLAPDLLAAIGERLLAMSDAVGPIDVVRGEELAVVVPLRAHLAQRAALVAVYDAGYRSDDVEERGLLASFADQAALALDRAQALAERERLAQVSDRERIARDLHDVVIQRLFAAGLQLQSLRAAVTEPDVVARIDATVDDLNQTIRAIRTTIFDLQARSPDVAAPKTAGPGSLGSSPGRFASGEGLVTRPTGWAPSPPSA